jgi:hypothetical protein
MAGFKRQADVRSLARGVFSEADREPLLQLSLLRRHWPDVVGPELAGRTHPRRLERGTLWIAAPDACWAYELQFFKSELLGSVQTFLESQVVRELRFQVGEVPAGEASPSGAGAGMMTSGPLTSGPLTPSPLTPHLLPTDPGASLRPEPSQFGTAGHAPGGAEADGVEAERDDPAAGEPDRPGAEEAISDPTLRRAFQRLLTRRRTRA